MSLLDQMLADPEAVKLLRAVRQKHPGGRPKGVGNSGPDALDKAVMALNVRRLRMTPEQRAESEERVARYMTRRFSRKALKTLDLPASQNAVWLSKALRETLVALGIPRQELEVVVAYRRSEARAGLGKTKRFKAAPATIGAGHEEQVVPDEPTEKELAGEVEPAKPHRKKRNVGYVTVPEDGAQESLEAIPLALWGVQVVIEPDYEPVRARNSKRSWLAPIRGTEDFTIGRRDVVGAGDGDNGRVLPEIDGPPEPTIGECRRMVLATDPVHGDEPEEDRGTRKLVLGKPAKFLARWCRIQGMACNGTVAIDVACIRPRKVADKDWEVRVTMERWRAPEPTLSVVLPVRPYGDKESRRYAKPLARFVNLHRSEGELRAGPYETKWREATWRQKVMAITIREMMGKISPEQAQKAIKKAKKWLRPIGMLPEPAKPVDSELFAFVEAQRAVDRKRAMGLKARWKAMGLLTGRALRPMPIWHTTDRSILTPQIKKAVMAVYGRPLPRSPLLPR